MTKSKILQTLKDINKPAINLVITKGWYLRLLKKKVSGKQFTKLSRKQKKEIKEYWNQYGKNISSQWCSYFSYGNGIVDKRYIPESLYYGEILKKLNNQSMGDGLGDKNMYDSLFNTKQPKTIIRKANDILLNKEFSPIDFEDAFKLCSRENNIIIKPANVNYGGGEGIKFWSEKEGKENLTKILNSYSDCIVQEIVKQHPFFGEIHPYSLNTLRIVTLLIKGKPVHLSTILRMGSDKSKIDNVTAGGLVCAVDNNGYLYSKSIQSDQSIISKHPDGFTFKDKEIPFYEKIINDAKCMHFRIPYFKMVSWDYSLTIDGEPILIEGNYPNGQLDFHQLNIGPIFGEYTDLVLNYVYRDVEL